MKKNEHKPEAIRVIGCGMIAQEILDLCEQLNLTHIDLKCLPAMWHHYPDKIAGGVEEAIKTAKKQGFKNVFVAYADCGTGGQLDKVCQKYNVQRIPGPHCFSFYMGNQKFEQNSDELMRSFFITDFLAKNFDTFLIKPLGLDKHPELKSTYFGNYEQVVYLAQTQNKKLEDKAKKAAKFLGLKYKKMSTGYGDLKDNIQKFS